MQKNKLPFSSHTITHGKITTLDHKFRDCFQGNSTKHLVSDEKIIKRCGDDVKELSRCCGKVWVKLTEVGDLLIRWNVLPLQCKGTPLFVSPFSPVQSARKFSEVIGVSLKRPNTMRPLVPCSTSMSKNTLCSTVWLHFVQPFRN